MKDKVNALFPRRSDIPQNADFAPNGGTYTEGTAYLVNGEIRRWSGLSAETLSAVCLRDEAGRVKWSWKRDTDALDPHEAGRLVGAGFLKESESLCRFLLNDRFDVFCVLGFNHGFPHVSSGRRPPGPGGAGT